MHTAGDTPSRGARARRRKERATMEDKVREKLMARLERFRELEGILNSPEGPGDPRYADMLREYGSLRESMGVFQHYLKTEEELESSRALAADKAEDREMRELAREECQALEQKAQALVEQLMDMLYGNAADDSRNVMLEIRAGTGGEEAALFAGDLLRMYMAYADTMGWKVEEVSASPSEHGGFKEAIVSVQGEGAFQALKFEGGGHRVQRVPETENQGRIHTSAATVAVLPEAEEYELEIHPQELRIETVRATGPGGQSVNTTDSAVRITHLPTGLIVHVADEKSQLKNKHKAMRVLRSRLYELKKREEEAARAAERKEQVGSGDRSERIRTYNFPQDRCTDHRLGRNFSLNDIIHGKLQKLTEALVEYGKQQEL